MTARDLSRIGTWCSLVALLVVPVVAAAQEAPAPAGRVRVLVDCPNTNCDQNFFQTEIKFVDHVRERQDADVHLQITSQATGAGGNELTFSFFGQGRFTGRDHVLRHATVPAQSQDVIRRDMVRVISLGLVLYAIDSPAAATLAVTTQQAAVAAPALQEDPWNRWTFRTRFQGYTQGEKSNKSFNVNTNFNANRTTEAMKLNLSTNGNYSENSFELTDGRKFISPSRNWGVNGLWVKSLDGHWSAGVRGSTSGSSFQNIDQQWAALPAIEYDIFPYAESTRRLFTLQYAAGLRGYDYKETTIYGKDQETRGAHAFTSSISMRQRWGQLSSGFEAASYLPEFSKNHVSGWNDLSLNLIKGLALNFYVELSSIRDQLYLPAGDITNEEVLVRQTQLATRYRYYFNFGVTYTFGSIYSPVVNPRMNN